ncbi:winged helix DNA-binding domain-containing protein [Mucilaginibacter sp.]|uniref:winged helix DNA-binding domain-containing protein n=1 Tax=Mucilaginibacter sp. TaxID=1882438 RepID=UPI0025CF633F|nr:winged helix DNA-binding domain-containing protein [Mucilaginibacter sp.]
MTNSEIARQRLFNQNIASQSFKKPAEIVRHMGAVQAQDYAGAKWAVGMRLQKSKDAAIDKALANGSIIRTHVLRPTWHFVTPADARWMIELTAPRINILAAGRHRQLKLDSKTLKLSNDILAGALDGKKQLTRLELQDALHKAGINTDEQRFVHILMQAELDKVICSGGRQGKQFTYALFDKRVPKGNDFTHDEAVAELVKRYFISRGPATLQDFTWWSGLSVADAKNGLEASKGELDGIEINGLTYWMAKNQSPINSKAPLAHLLPAYDEFAVAYSDRTAIINPKYVTQAKYVIFAPSIVANNQVVGTWKRTIKKNEVEVVLEPFGKFNKAQTTAVEAAVKRYQRFVIG